MALVQNIKKLKRHDACGGSPKFKKKRISAGSHG